MLPLELRQACYILALREAEGVCHIFPGSGRFAHVACAQPRLEDHSVCWSVLECFEMAVAQIGGRRLDSDFWARRLNGQFVLSPSNSQICLNLVLTCRRVSV